MRRPNDGGPAFPSGRVDRSHMGEPDEALHDGLSLLDYFAARAMQGLCTKDGYDTWQDLAGDAFCIADAMLKAREVSP